MFIVKESILLFFGAMIGGVSIPIFGPVIVGFILFYMIHKRTTYEHMIIPSALGIIVAFLLIILFMGVPMFVPELITYKTPYVKMAESATWDLQLLLNVFVTGIISIINLLTFLTVLFVLHKKYGVHAPETEGGEEEISEGTVEETGKEESSSHPTWTTETGPEFQDMHEKTEEGEEERDTHTVEGTVENKDKANEEVEKSDTSKTDVLNESKKKTITGEFEEAHSLFDDEEMKKRLSDAEEEKEMDVPEDTESRENAIDIGEWETSESMEIEQKGTDEEEKTKTKGGSKKRTTKVIKKRDDRKTTKRKGKKK